MTSYDLIEFDIKHPKIFLGTIILGTIILGYGFASYPYYVSNS